MTCLCTRRVVLQLQARLLNFYTFLVRSMKILPLHRSTHFRVPGTSQIEIQSGEPSRRHPQIGQISGGLDPSYLCKTRWAPSSLRTSSHFLIEISSFGWRQIFSQSSALETWLMSSILIYLSRSVTVAMCKGVHSLMPNLSRFWWWQTCNVSSLWIPPEVWVNEVRVKGSVKMEWTS